MRQLADTCEAIAANTRKNEKIRLLADYFRSQNVAHAAASAVFLSGRPFPAYQETTLQVGGSLLARVLIEVSQSDEFALRRAYRQRGDLGAAASDLLSRKQPKSDDVGAGEISVLDVLTAFRDIASARGPALKASLLHDLLSRASPLEAKYIIKIITGELRIGLKEGLVEESIAVAYACPVADVQRANMLLGDIGETLRFASEHRLADARMRLFHPLGFMLANPAESTADAFSCFQHALVEHKYDGIRAQAHISASAQPSTTRESGKDVAPRVRIFSRTLDEISDSFPELISPLTGFQEDAILDGEILAWDFNQQRALPFHRLQQRLGRKRPTTALMRNVPVAYVVFDVLYAGSALVIDRPLSDRTALLDRLFRDRADLEIPAHPRIRSEIEIATNAQRVLPFDAAEILGQGTAIGLSPGSGEAWMADQHAVSVNTVAASSNTHSILRAPGQRADSPEHLAEIFEAALAGGNEGLMIKDIASPYTPGRRGRSWLKLKRELATLDVVVTSVEWGHGRRINVLSDYTFAVRNSQHLDPSLHPGDELLNIGKAYSGLTDKEIAELTNYFLTHTTADHGFWREVEPNLVIEVAFNGIMRSDRHNSGYALRFPRILRLRPDKSPPDIDTLERVREIYDSQKFPRSA